MTDLRARIAAFAGEYSLPTGEVPVVDGVPAWPWDEAVARQRLQSATRQLKIDLTGTECLVPSGSNDVWLLDDLVLRICWRGDLDRFAREAALSTRLPSAVLYPRLAEYGRDEHQSWILGERVRGQTLDEVWPTAPERELQGYAETIAEMLATLHSWTPGPDLARMLVEAAPTDDDDAITIVGKTVVPATLPQQRRLADYARSMPFVDGDVLDRIVRRLAASPAITGPCVFLNGDFTPWNVMVRDGRVVALLDYEFARFGPREADLTTLMIWRDWQPRDARADRLVTWMRGIYPAVFAEEDLENRLWRYHAAFALRGIIAWPPDAPEPDVQEGHFIRFLRELSTR